MTTLSTWRASGFVACLAIGIALLGPNAGAATNTYMKFGGIEGESKDDAHHGWIEVESFSWGAADAATSGARASRVAIHEITIRKRPDKTSPELSLAASAGRHFENVVIETANSGGRKMVITLDDAIISSIRIADAAGGYAPTEAITLHFARYSTTAPSETMRRMDAVPQTQAQ